MFAGPNGSGKTPLFRQLNKQKIIHTDLYISADDIEPRIRKDGHLRFGSSQVDTSEEEFLHHVRETRLNKVSERKQLVTGPTAGADVAYINNSVTSMELMAEVRCRKLVSVASPYPDWLKTYFDPELL